MSTDVEVESKTKPFPFPKPKTPAPKIRKEFKDCVSVQDALQIGFDEMLYADFVIECSDGKLPCHQSVLAAVSPFIRSILEEIPYAVHFIVPDITKEIMTKVLSIFYTGQVCSPAQEDFEEIKEALELFGLNIDSKSWTVVNAIVIEHDKPEDSSKNTTTSTSASQAKTDTATATAPPPSDVEDGDDSADDVRIIDDDKPAAYQVSPPAKKRKFKNRPATAQKSQQISQAAQQQQQQQQLQSLINIQPKTYSFPVPVVPQLQMAPQMFVAPSTNDVIQAMLQSKQLSLGPAFSTASFQPQQQQYFQQQPPTYVTGIHPGLAGATAPTYVNQGAMPMSMPMQMPMQLGFYPQQGQQIQQPIPSSQAQQQLQQQPQIQQQQLRPPAAGTTFYQNGGQQQLRPPATATTTFFQNGGQRLPVTTKNVIRIPMSAQSPGQGQGQRGQAVMTARMTKVALPLSSGGKSVGVVSNGHAQVPQQYQIIQTQATPSVEVSGSPDTEMESDDPEEGVVYVIDEASFYQTAAGDDECSMTSSDPSTIEVEDGEEIEILGWNVDDQENTFQMSHQEIMSNQQVSSKKDHAYAFFAPKETKRIRRLRIQAEELESSLKKLDEV